MDFGSFAVNDYLGLIACLVGFLKVSGILAGSHVISIALNSWSGTTSLPQTSEYHLKLLRGLSQEEN